MFHSFLDLYILLFLLLSVSPVYITKCQSVFLLFFVFLYAYCVFACVRLFVCVSLCVWSFVCGTWMNKSDLVVCFCNIRLWVCVYSLLCHLFRVMFFFLSVRLFVCFLVLNGRGSFFVKTKISNPCKKGRTVDPQQSFRASDLYFFVYYKTTMW